MVQTIIAHDLKKEKMQSAPAVQSSKIYHRDRKRASTHSSTLRNNMKKPKNQ